MGDTKIHTSHMNTTSSIQVSDYGYKHEKHKDIHLLSQATDREPNPRLKKKNSNKRTTLSHQDIGNLHLQLLL